MTDALERIAAALERLAPSPPAAADPLAHGSYGWHAGRLSVVHPEPLPLDRLLGIDTQKTALLTNLERLAQGHAAHDALLWGARGTGKSALALSAVAVVQRRYPALALVAVAAIADLPALLAALAVVPRPVAVMIDDLGVDGAGEARALRSLLEGAAATRPARVRLIVTANRRHLQPRDAAGEDGARHARDAAEDALALADRFGLSLGFHALDQEGYLAIVAGEAAANGLAVDRADALAWAATRGNRSGRVAAHYLVELAGRAGRPAGRAG